jgi:hypothetical protein
MAVHAGSRPPPTGQTPALMLADPGVTKSRGRPSVSDDNRFSESRPAFMILGPDSPKYTGWLEDARAHAGPYSIGTTTAASPCRHGTWFTTASQPRSRINAGGT